jgi:hypothetical protein
VLTLFWNPRSLDRETVLGRGIALDQYSAPRLVVRRDGALLRDGSPLTTPLLVDATGTVARFAGARRAQQGDGYELWRPAGTPRLELLGEGFWRDGRLDTRSDVRLWPAGTARLRGTLVLGFRADAARRSLLRLSWPGGSADVRLAPGQSQRVRLPIDTARPFTLRIDALAGSMFDGSRRTAGFAAAPVFARS